MENLYLLVIILKNQIFYKNAVINLKTEPLILKVKKWIISVLFNILLLGNNKAVLGTP